MLSRTTALAAVLYALPVVVAGQSRPDLYQCEGCEAVLERPAAGLSSAASIPPKEEPGEPFVLTGRIFRPDGTTPAPGVVVYAYHTNAKGVYPSRDSDTGWARRHGYLRAWVKTDAKGDYRFQTIRPASYPSRQAPAHVHLMVKEPERPPYWIDEVVFTDDPLVTARHRAQAQNRGGSGVVTPTRGAEGTWTARRDIVLER